MRAPYIMKLWRRGAKTCPIFTIIVSLKRTRHHGIVIDKLGYYDPSPRNKKIFINMQKLAFWLNKGVKIRKSLVPILAEMSI